MPKFKSIDALYEYAQNNIADLLLDSHFEDELSSMMTKAVEDYVYAAYSPTSYNRRDINGGLADPENSMITGINVDNGKIHIIFENLTQGNDNLSGEYIGDLIEFGEGYKDKHWDNPNGQWAKPRPFVENMISDIQDNPTYLINALKKDLLGRGFKVKY